MSYDFPISSVVVHNNKAEYEQYQTGTDVSLIQVKVHQTKTKINVDPDMCHHMASLGHNVSMKPVAKSDHGGWFNINMPLWRRHDLMAVLSPPVLIRQYIYIESGPCRLWVELGSSKPQPNYTPQISHFILVDAL